jgi:hypothetical protein
VSETPRHAGAYPDLTFDRLGEYLARGVWPFLVQLIVNLPVGFAFGMLWTLGMMLVSIAAASDSGVLGGIVVILLFIVYLLIVVALGVISAPLYLRAGLSSDFAGAFSMAFLRDFLRRVGKETLLITSSCSSTSCIWSAAARRWKPSRPA